MNPARRQALRTLAGPRAVATALALSGGLPSGLAARLAAGFTGAGAGGLAAALGGCALLPRPNTIPMDLIDLPGLPANAAANAATNASNNASAKPSVEPGTDRLVFLPGAYSLPREFIDEGFVAALREGPAARPGLHLQIADAHLGYFQDQTVLERLHADVVLPAQAGGVQRLWLVGISLGGFAALAYAARFAAGLAAEGRLRLAGVLAIAPYLGTAALIQSITHAGGPRAWAARGGRSDTTIRTDDAAAEVWRWLCARNEPADVAHEIPSAPAPGSAPRNASAHATDAPVPVWLAHGEQDRFAAAHRLMATLLPPSHVSHAPGDHDWPAWRRLWQDWLALGLLPR